MSRCHGRILIEPADRRITGGGYLRVGEDVEDRPIGKHNITARHIHPGRGIGRALAEVESILHVSVIGADNCNAAIADRKRQLVDDGAIGQHALGQVRAVDIPAGAGDAALHGFPDPIRPGDELFAAGQRTVVLVDFERKQKRSPGILADPASGHGLVVAQRAVLGDCQEPPLALDVPALAVDGLDSGVDSVAAPYLGPGRL